MLKGLVVSAGVVIGLFFFGLAAIYLSMPADHLPAFMPGYDPDSTSRHLTHGIGLIGVALIAFAMALLRIWGD